MMRSNWKSGETGHVDDHNAIARRLHNVMDCGAKADGVTDDGPALQAAIDALGPKGGTVFIPTGVYSIQTGVVVPGLNVRLVGDGNGSYRQFDLGPVLLAATPGMELLRFDYGSSVGHVGFALENLALRDTTGQTATLVVGRLNSRWTLRNVSFSDAALALKLDAGRESVAGGDASWGLVDQCFFNSCTLGIHAVGVSAFTVLGGSFTCTKGILTDPICPNVKVIGSKFDGGVGVHLRGYASGVIGCGFEDCDTALIFDGDETQTVPPAGQGNYILGGSVVGWQQDEIGIQVTDKAIDTAIGIVRYSNVGQRVVDAGKNTIYWTHDRTKRAWDTASLVNLDFPSIPAGGQAEMSVTIAGAAVDDYAYANPRSAPEAGLMWSAYVSAPDTITIRMVNATSAAINPANRAWMVGLQKQTQLAWV
jgi:hypothetical protein